MDLLVAHHELLPGSTFDNSKDGTLEFTEFQHVRASQPGLGETGG